MLFFIWYRRASGLSRQTANLLFVGSNPSDTSLAHLILTGKEPVLNTGSNPRGRAGSNPAVGAMVTIKGSERFPKWLLILPVSQIGKAPDSESGD